MRKLVTAAALGLVMTISLAGCGDDDGGSDEPDTGVDGGVDDGVDGGDAGEVDGDDLVAVFLSGSGLTPDIMSDAEHDCMNAELDAVYPDGFPEGFREDQEVTEEVSDAVDAAAEACDVVL